MEYYDISGFPNYRLVRDSKRDFHVESKNNGVWEKIGSDDGCGHIGLCLYGNKKHIYTYIHCIVAEMFVPNTDNKEIVHHKDFDPSNNDPANLLWVSRSQHRAIHNTVEVRKKISEHFKGRPRPEGAGKPPKPVESISPDGVVVWYESMHDAARQTGIQESSISRCCNGKRESAGGRKWRYK